MGERSDDRFREVWIERLGHRSPEWITNEGGEAGVEGHCQFV